MSINPIDQSFAAANDALRSLYSRAAEADRLEAENRALREQLASPTPPNPTPNPNPTPTVTRDGMVIWFSDRPAEYDRGLDELGMDDGRGWITLGRDNEQRQFDPYRIDLRDIANALNWKRAGYGTTAACVPAFNCFNEMRRLGNDARQLPERHAATIAAAMPTDSAIDVAEVGNEPDLRGIYWTPGWEHFLSDYYVPFTRTMRRHRPAVKICAPALGNQANLVATIPQYAAAIRALPADVKPDRIAVHLYPRSIGDLTSAIAAVQQHLMPIAPVDLTEWNFDATRVPADRRVATWRGQLPECARLIARAGFERSFFYRLYQRKADELNPDEFSAFLRDTNGRRSGYFADIRDALRAARVRQ